MLKNITITRFVFLLTLIIPLFASASSLTTLQTCQSCHGLKGEGVKNFTPMLAGLDEKYLDQQINLFRTGRRVNLMMTPMAELLADPKERETILTFFSSQPAPEITSLEFRGDHAKISDPARRLVYQGDWSRNIPACATCHGASGMGVADVPRLANQRPEYLEIQLQQWQSGLIPDALQPAG
jgi:cytochrome c553